MVAPYREQRYNTPPAAMELPTYPVAPPPPPPSPLASQVQGEVDARMSSVRMNAWLLWFIAGGVAAHLAYLYPRNRALILTVAIVLFVVTVGISGVLCWLFTWPVLCASSATDEYRAKVRSDVETEMLRHRQVYYPG